MTKLSSFWFVYSTHSSLNSLKDLWLILIVCFFYNSILAQLPERNPKTSLSSINLDENKTNTISTTTTNKQKFIESNSSSSRTNDSNKDLVPNSLRSIKKATKSNNTSSLIRRTDYLKHVDCLPATFLSFDNRNIKTSNQTCINGSRNSFSAVYAKHGSINNNENNSSSYLKSVLAQIGVYHLCFSFRFRALLPINVCILMLGFK